MQRTYYSSTAYIIPTHAEHMQKLKEDAKERFKKRFSIRTIATRFQKPKQKIKRALMTSFWSVLSVYYGFVLLHVLFS